MKESKDVKIIHEIEKYWLTLTVSYNIWTRITQAKKYSRFTRTIIYDIYKHSFELKIPIKYDILFKTDIFRQSQRERQQRNFCHFATIAIKCTLANI